MSSTLGRRRGHPWAGGSEGIAAGPTFFPTCSLPFCPPPGTSPPSNFPYHEASAGLPARPKFEIREGNRPSPSPGVNKKLYTATIKEAPSQSLMTWLVQATGPNTEGLTGLEVYQIKVAPNKAPGVGVGWDADVILTRLERGS